MSCKIAKNDQLNCTYIILLENLQSSVYIADLVNSHTTIFLPLNINFEMFMHVQN